MRRRILRALERRRDAHFACAVRYPIGSLGDERHMYMARVFEMLASAVRR
jgi:hypothetical protein